MASPNLAVKRDCAKARSPFAPRQQSVKAAGMHRIFILTIVMASTLAGTPAYSAQQARQEPIEWSDIWIVNANKNDRPRVLLVGDSIVKGYYPSVETRLSGKANCARYATSKFLGNPDYLAELGLLLKRYKFDVIHINNGLHGWDYTEKEYREGLHGLLATLKRYAPKAKLIWCMTTPVRTGGNLSQFNTNQNNRVIQRNRIATEIMNHNKIPINNLYEEVKDHPEYFVKDGIHYSDRGKMVQAKKIAEMIEKSLPNKAHAGNGK